MSQSVLLRNAWLTTCFCACLNICLTALQVGDLQLQLTEQEQQQQLRQAALASQRASIEEELQPQRQLLHDQALADLQRDVAQEVEASWLALHAYSTVLRSLCIALASRRSMPSDVDR